METTLKTASLGRADSDSKSSFTNAGRSPNAEFALFEPEYDDHGNLIDLRESHKQLAEMDEFKSLMYSDLHFVNAYANPASPLVIKNLPDHERITMAMEFAYGEDISDDMREIYFLHQWSEDIENAIGRMKRFNVAYRSQANAALERTFSNIMNLNEKMETFMKTYRITEDNMEVVTKFANSTKTFTPIINDLILQMEKTGVRSTKKSGNDRRDIFSDVRKKMSRR